MHEGFGGDYTNNGMKGISVNQGNKVSRQRLVRSNWRTQENEARHFYCTDSCIGRQKEDPKGLSRVVREQQLLVIFEVGLPKGNCAHFIIMSGIIAPHIGSFHQGESGRITT